jgi:hypothetical protein
MTGNGFKKLKASNRKAYEALLTMRFDRLLGFWSRVRQLSDSEPQESEQAETKQKDKAGEDV